MIKNKTLYSANGSSMLYKFSKDFRYGKDFDNTPIEIDIIIQIHHDLSCDYMLTLDYKVVGNYPVIKLINSANIIIKS